MNNHGLGSDYKYRLTCPSKNIGCSYDRDQRYDHSSLHGSFHTESRVACDKNSGVWPFGATFVSGWGLMISAGLMLYKQESYYK